MPKKRVSKHSRDWAKERQKRAPQPTPEMPVVESQPNSLWVIRQVTDSDSLKTAAQLLEAVRDIDPAAVPMIGQLNMGIVTSHEVTRILQSSRLQGSAKARVSKLARKIELMGMASLDEPVDATVSNIKQFRNNISLDLDYKDYLRERAAIAGVIGRVVGSNYGLSPRVPYLNFAQIPNTISKKELQSIELPMSIWLDKADVMTI